MNDYASKEEILPLSFLPLVGGGGGRVSILKGQEYPYTFLKF